MSHQCCRKIHHCRHHHQRAVVVPPAVEEPEVREMIGLELERQTLLRFAVQSSGFGGRNLLAFAGR